MFFSLAWHSESWVSKSVAFPRLLVLLVMLAAQDQIISALDTTDSPERNARDDLVIRYLHSLRDELKRSGGSSVAADGSLPIWRNGCSSGGADTSLPTVRFTALPPSRDFSVNIRQSPSACSVQMTLDFAYTTSSFTKAEGPPCQAKLRLCALLNFLKRLLSSKHHVLNETTRCSYDSSDKFFGHVEHNTSRLEFNWARCNALDVTDLVAVGARRWQNLVLSITLNATGTPVSSIQAQLPTGEEQAQERISSSTYKDLLLEHMQNYTDAGLIHLAMPLDQQDTREVLAAHLHSLPHMHRNRRRRSTAGRQCRKSFVKVPSADLGLILDWKIIAPRELNLSYCSGGCVDGEHVPPTNYHRFLAAFRHTTRPFGSISPGPPLPACVPSGYSVIEYVIVGSVPTPELRLQHGVAGCACY